MIKITKEHTVAECVASNYQTATVFKKYKIDFCCGGKISIQDVCKRNKIDEKALLRELNQTIKKPDTNDNKKNLELDLLIDHILTNHHSYVRKRVPEIEPFLEKLVRVHGTKHPELQKVQEYFLDVKEELFSHMQKEENVLFPYIKEMVEVKKNHTELNPPFFGTIKNPIQMMEMEHELVGNKLKEIKQITNNLTPPDGACNTYRVTFFLLDEFENDLHRHIHLENNVLFPKAIKLENTIVK